MFDLPHRFLIRVAFAAMFWMGGPFSVTKLMAEPSKSITGDAAVTTASVKSLPVRFANPATSEVPDFQRHVMPLLGRLGCNGRACHGSFQGRGGFQLSLFGYDFVADHEALLSENSGRVDPDDVVESLILAKPIDEEMHEGGKRLDHGSWQYNTLHRWIEAGAKFQKGNPQSLTRLEIVPGEIAFQNENQDQPLRAIAHWDDGSIEDVTDLCRFASNDDAVAAIDENGLVQSGLEGDTHVVVSYDRAVVPVAVTRRVVSTEEITPPPESDHPIDRLIAAKLHKLGITPSQICTDAEFIRRASLDITGTLPAAADVRDFLADSRVDKRVQLVNELLEAPGYAAWWATRMSDWTGNSEEQLNNVLPIRNVASRLWYEWLRVRLDDNVPYDQIVEGMVDANSRQDGESYLDYCTTMTKACKKGNESEYASRDGNPLFWARRNFQKGEDRAIGFAYAFLGVRIECAQCHKHPFDQWSKNDFDQFAKLFQNVDAKRNTVARENRETQQQLINKITGGKKLNNGDLQRLINREAADGGVVPFPELTYNARTNNANKARLRKLKKAGKEVPNIVASGYVLGDADAIELDQDPRDELMAWLRDPANPYFSRAIVNRVWSNYFGVGIINPTDDMNLANPPSNAPLLDYLAAQFQQHEFDLQWLHRTIVTSDAYARSTTTNPSNKNDRLNFSRHVPRRLPAEVIRDAVYLATESVEQTEKMRSEMQQMSIAADVMQNRNNKDFALQVFGQSQRESNCDCDRSDDPSLLQSIYLRNDTTVYQQLGSKKGWVAQACASLGESGPAGREDNRSTQISRKADQIRLQTIARIERFQKSPERIRPQQIAKAKKAYRDTRERFDDYGFEAPSFEKLMENPSAWKLTPRVSKRESKAETSLDTVIEEAYLRTLSRMPDPKEQTIAQEFVDESESVANGLASLMWALVNTKEFIITH